MRAREKRKLAQEQMNVRKDASDLLFCLNRCDTEEAQIDMLAEALQEALDTVRAG
jgi:hypothetical protein